MRHRPLGALAPTHSPARRRAVSAASRRAARAIGLVAVAALAGGTVLMPAAAAPGSPSGLGGGFDRSGAPTPDLASVAGLEPVYGKRAAIAPGLAEADPDETVTAFVQLDAPSAVDLHGQGRSRAQVRDGIADVEAMADAVLPRSRERSADLDRTAVTTNVVAGFTVTGGAGEVRELAEERDVLKVWKVTPKQVVNKGQDGFTRAVEAWRDTGRTGKGVRIGVIDTGLDYTHAAFGGPGTAEAFEAATAENGTLPVPDGVFDSAKYLGGYDFAGHTYDARYPDLDTPEPDPNPIDSYDDGGGHGTHVAGSAAGYGVLPDGSTFRGDYADLDGESLLDWRVGPGTAPEAGIYALKVFGDLGGSTNVVIPALDHAADPNGDGDVSDRLDILNLSLGSDGSPADDPESLFIDQLAEIGTLSVIASGNAGDITDIGGSPGNAASAITVANSVGSHAAYDAIAVAEPADVAGPYPFQNSINYTGDDVTAPAAFVADDFTGCSAFTAEQEAAVDGKFVYLYWDDNNATRPCGSTARFDNAEAAGAVGVLLSSDLEVFSGGIAGNAGIPGGQLTRPATEALLPAIQEGTVVVTAGPSLANSTYEEISLGDTLNPGSSRGVHGSLGVVKPDVAAPGTAISSAGAGHGTQPVIMSGTSMASPHTAGIAALVAQDHPTWSPARVKAAVMNTATHDVYTEAEGEGVAYGPERVGSGRVDSVGAVRTDVLAYAADAPELVSVGFGVVPVERSARVTRTVKVVNTGHRPATYRTSYLESSTAGGARISVWPESFTVRPGRTAKVRVTLTADARSLVREIGPASSETASIGGARDYLAMVTGRLQLTPVRGTGGEALRVPVQAAPRPVADIAGKTVRDRRGGTETLELTGRGVSTGGWTSIVAPFALEATSPALPPSAWSGTSRSAIRQGDIRAVGFASTAPQYEAAGFDPSSAAAGIGIATEGEWASLGLSTVPVVLVDIDDDGAFDYEIDVVKFSNNPNAVATDDVTVAVTFDLRTGQDIWAEYANGLDGSVDTGVFDNNVVTVPVQPWLLGLAPGDTPTFQVATFSWYATGEGQLVDAAEPFTADPYAPPIWFDGENDVLYASEGGMSLAVHRAEGAEEAELLLLHYHNATPGKRWEIVDAPSSRSGDGHRPPWRWWQR
ncbi:S8 family peptidase [Myceligenerans pegani]|uniref:S8 family serine peptidase n=1 Tax=Myceligenerans pegani TaxID=2776917 RepID=A0ABR9N6P4_9MICO|nr:S8 family serine peptidase [Myceligenerans sp. TRM 65318]MBE1878813.1 S8 family serine peptidase [Myceligenerans sp. TRM 65318]MBE3021084.1 S8 family serine peptidase [Myceligenerans sp. TRM 65318]